MLLGAALFLGLIAGCSAGAVSTEASLKGSRAPDFELPDLNGQVVSLSDFRGKPVFINFWASWCGPCRDEIPYIQEIFEDKEWIDRGLVILAINLGEDSSTVTEFMQAYGLSFTVLLDSKLHVAQEYNIRPIPTTFLIDEDGIIQDIKIGSFPGKAEIEQRMLNAIVKE